MVRMSPRIIDLANSIGDSPHLITWDFQLRKVGIPEYGGTVQPSTPGTPAGSEPNPFNITKRVGSISDLSFLVAKSETEPTRKGVIVPVTYLDEAEEYLPKAIELIPRRKQAKPHGLMANLEGKRRPVHTMTEDQDGLSAVCNVAVRDIESKDDKDIYSRIEPIVGDAREELLARGIRRITFICGHPDGTYPGYFTFRYPQYNEDESIRHIEPALAFQLELGRLSNFNIKPVFTGSLPRPFLFLFLTLFMANPENRK